MEIIAIDNRDWMLRNNPFFFQPHEKKPPAFDPPSLFNFSGISVSLFRESWVPPEGSFCNASFDEIIAPS